MPLYFYAFEFVSGLFLANGLPHFVQGVSGQWFQSPFGYPPGVGQSSPLSNTLWGSANLAVGFILLWFFTPQGSEAAAGWIVVAMGVCLPLSGCPPISAGCAHNMAEKFMRDSGLGSIRSVLGKRVLQ